MEYYSDDDVTAVEVDESGAPSTGIPENRPIMLLFKKLIGNDNKKKKMLLTDVQIKEMLKEEFGINTEFLYDVEVDIYLAVTKKFLKSWPQWNNFNNLVNGLQSANAYSSLKKIYDRKYVQFKEYLGAQLEATKHLAAQTVQSIAQKNQEITESSDLVLEVVCSRPHLNQLVYRVPNSTENDIFKGLEPVPTQISLLNEHTLETILNWWFVTVSLNLNVLSYKRETKHELEHLLINNARNVNRMREIKLDQDLMMKAQKRSDYCDKSKIIAILQKILLQYTNNIKAHYLIQTVFNLILDDLKALPNVVKIHTQYKQYENRYKYVRFLNASDSKQPSGKYDIQLQEVLSPMHMFRISKVEPLNALLPPFEEWFTIECGLCKKEFSGENSTAIIFHFNQHHQGEPDWQCYHCKKTFRMIDLAKRKWSHTC